jgi:spore maturation protein CgeB
MKLLIVGANNEYAIERFYLKYWQEDSNDLEVSFFESQNVFYHYYNKNTFNKIIYKLGISAIYNIINKLFISKIDSFKPDIIFVFKGMEISPISLKWAKQQKIKLVNYNPDNPFIFSGKGSGNANITNSIDLYDFHFTYNLEIQKQLEEKHQAKTGFLPFAYDVSQELHDECATATEIVKACFVGNPDKIRANFIEQLAYKGVEIDVYGHNWDYFIKHKNIKSHHTVSDKELWYTLRKYRIQLNIMRPHNLNSHNMRTFEIPGIGGIQLASFTKEHQLFFEEGKEIFLYENIEDCVAKINYLLALLPAQACELRMFAREAAISKKHSYKDMALQVMEVLEKL